MSARTCHDELGPLFTITEDELSRPHGRTRGMHFCFARSDLDDFKATLKPRVRPKTRSD